MSKNSVFDFFLGIYDSLQIFNIHEIILSPKISNNLISCLLLNGFVSLGSALLYSKIIQPSVLFILESTGLTFFLYIGAALYYILWLFPLFIICLLLTTFKTDEIYYDTYELVDKNKNEHVEVGGLTSLSNIVQRLIIVISFTIYIKLLGLIYWLKPLQWATMSILNSLYVFEYILLQKKIKDFKKILNFMEDKLFYFLGFGMLLTFIVNNITNFATEIFLMAYPFFMIASVKVYSYRFNSNNNSNNSESTSVTTKRVRFLYIISKLYDLGISILLYLRNKKSN
jgi:hypothetical protein